MNMRPWALTVARNTILLVQKEVLGCVHFCLRIVYIIDARGDYADCRPRLPVL